MRGQLHHIEIYCSNLIKTRDFYSWLLNFLDYKIYQEWTEGFSFKLGETYIVFVQTEKRFLDVPYHRCRTGLNHLAFHASSKDDVDRLTDFLKQKHIKILYSDKHPHAGGNETYSVFFEDPDRIKLEFTFTEKISI